MIQDHQDAKREPLKSSVTPSLCSKIVPIHAQKSHSPRTSATTLSCPCREERGTFLCRRYGGERGTAGLPAADYFSVHRLVLVAGTICGHHGKEGGQPWPGGAANGQAVSGMQYLPGSVPVPQSSALSTHLLRKMSPELHPSSEPDTLVSSMPADIHPPRTGCLSPTKQLLHQQPHGGHAAGT